MTYELMAANNDGTGRADIDTPTQKQGTKQLLIPSIFRVGTRG